MADLAAAVQDPRNDRYRIRVRILALAVMLSAPVLLLFSIAVAEPYPALMGPGFAGRPARGGNVSIVDCSAEVACASGVGSVHVVGCAELIEPLGVLRSKLTIEQLLPPKCVRPRIKSWRDRLKARFRRNSECQPLSDSTKHWLLQQATERWTEGAALGCAPALTIKYETVTIPMSSPETHRRRPLKEYRIE